MTPHFSPSALRLADAHRRNVLRWAAASAAAALAPCALAQSAASARGKPAAAPAADAAAISAHFPFGPVVPPRVLPAVPLTTHLAQPTDLASLMRGRLSAVQLMFTGCSATCPIQGAIFSEAQQQLGASIAGAQFVSLSIDPLSDTPAALAAWLKRFNARSGWTAAASRPGDLDALLGALRDGPPDKRLDNDPHTGQVYFVNRRGALVHRSGDLPSPEQVVALMRRIDSLA